VWTQPDNRAIYAADYYGTNIVDASLGRGAVAPFTTFKIAAAFTARNAALVLNGGAVNAGIPGHWPGLLFNRLTIGA
jgi:hypothetical protein